MRKQSGASDRDSLRGRLLMFDLDSCHYAIRAAAVTGVAECGPVREVPGAPRSMLGLAEWRGHLLTVLDLPRLLGHATPSGPACLIRLAPPLQGTSLFLPVNVRLASLAVRPTPAAETAAAERTEIHLMEHKDGRMTMRKTESLTIPAEGKVELKSGGTHLMLIDLRQPLEAGARVELVLRFGDGTQKRLAMPVRKGGYER